MVPSTDVMDGVHYSDEEDIVETKVVKKVIDKPLLSGVLASLVMDYGSDSSDNGMIEEHNIYITIWIWGLVINNHLILFGLVILSNENQSQITVVSIFLF